jgi:two-component system, NarL family, sensor histidine kinase UhpB
MLGLPLRPSNRVYAMAALALGGAALLGVLLGIGFGSAQAPNLAPNPVLPLGPWVLGAAVLALLVASGIAVATMRARAAAHRDLAAANLELQARQARHTETLRASEQRYRRLVELSNDAIVLCDGRRNIVHANAAAFRVAMAERPDMLLEQTVESLFVAEDQGWLIEWLSVICTEPGKHGLRPATLRTFGRTRVPVEVGGVSFQGDGEVQLQVVIHDLSVLRAEQAAVREQLRFIDQLIDAIPAPLSVRDEKGRYLRINTAYALLHRCDPTTVRHRSVFDVLPYELASQVAQHDAAAMRGTEAVTYDSRLAPAQRHACELLSRACALRRTDGSIVGVIAVDTEVTALRLKDRELVRINAELEALSHRLIRTQEDERRRIARDLHDHVGQILGVLKITLRRVAAQAAIDTQALAPVLALADDALAHARDLTASLHPHGLEDLGLEAAVRRQVERYVAPAIPGAILRIDLRPPRSTAQREMAAFRMVQEACSNAVKHAAASALKIDLEARDGHLMIAIADDGTGFDASSTVFDLRQRASLGIASMRERVAEIGGEFTIESAPGGGTAVRALMPW